MAQRDPTIEASKRLCDESKALRTKSKITVAEANDAIARSATDEENRGG
jgi:hypothetical protein